MAFIQKTTCEKITNEIPIVDRWVGKPMMIHTAAADIKRDNIHTDNHERYHVENLGWDHIGYMFSIEKDGVIYFSRPTANKQYHCIGDGQNHKSFGVCICGCGTKNYLTEEQYQSLLKIIKVYQVGTILVHRDFPYKGKTKSCPGDVLLADITKRFSALVHRV
ncbi:MAG: N-acetylmuramoyl-L-alanine amidase [Spirochaetota bacterium]|nr:N-acetylmuramoyl-L-alanine amidase [Spirochaetota bacterium]